MTEFLDRDDVLMAGAAAVGNLLQVRDYGLLDAAIARPKATVFGLDAYPDDFTKAAALLQSLARDHAFVDGNKRTAWRAAGIHDDGLLETGLTSLRLETYDVALRA